MRPRRAPARVHRVERDIVIAAPPDVVFRSLVEPSERAKWQRSFGEAAIEGAMRVGTRIRATRHGSTSGSSYEFVVTALEPGKRLAMDAYRNGQKVAVGSWQLPANLGEWTVLYQASPHYMALDGRTMFVSMYHAGLWAVDLSTPEKLALPPAIGVYLPDKVPVAPPPDFRGDPQIAPSDEQVDVFPDGTIVLTESSTGVYVLRFDASDPAPPALPYDYST